MTYLVASLIWSAVGWWMGVQAAGHLSDYLMRGRNTR